MYLPKIHVREKTLRSENGSKNAQNLGASIYLSGKFSDTLAQINGFQNDQINRFLVESPYSVNLFFQAELSYCTVEKPPSKNPLIIIIII